MEFLFLVLTAFFVFGALILSNKFFGKDAIFVIGIGSAIASNVYNVGNYPINIANFIFGIDSVVYTVFIFCIFICYAFYGKKDALTLLFSALGSLFLTALLQFIASWATLGFGEQIVWGFASYIISIIATLIAVYLSLKTFILLENKNINIYLNLIITIILASLINSIIYFGVVSLINGFSENFIGMLIGSYIGKFMCTFLSLLVFFLCQKYNYNIKEK